MLTLHTFGRDLKWNWYYIDHETEERVDAVDSSVSFMKKLILHIPDENFKMIRFYGCYASKNHRYRKLVTLIINNVNIIINIYFKASLTFDALS